MFNLSDPKMYRPEIVTHFKNESWCRRFYNNFYIVLLPVLFHQEPDGTFPKPFGFILHISKEPIESKVKGKQNLEGDFDKPFVHYI